MVFPTKASGELICITFLEGVVLPNQDRKEKSPFFNSALSSAAKKWNCYLSLACERTVCLITPELSLSVGCFFSAFGRKHLKLFWFYFVCRFTSKASSWLLYGRERGTVVISLLKDKLPLKTC